MVHDIVIFFHHLLKFTLDTNPGNYNSGAPFYNTKANDLTNSNVLVIKIYAILTQTYQYLDLRSYH